MRARASKPSPPGAGSGEGRRLRADSSRNCKRILAGRVASSSMKDWNTNENALLRGARMAPVGHAERDQRRLEVEVRDEARGELDAGDVRGVREALVARRVVAVADEVVVPRHELAGRVDARLQEVEAARPVVVVTHVVFARPQHLHRHADLLGDGGRFAHVVVREAPAEAAADAHRWMVMSASRDAERRATRAARPLAGVCVGAQISSLPFCEVRGAVLRLERGVREERIRRTPLRRPWPRPRAPASTLPSVRSGTAPASASTSSCARAREASLLCCAVGPSSHLHLQLLARASAPATSCRRRWRRRAAGREVSVGALDRRRRGARRASP